MTPVPVTDADDRFAAHFGDRRGGGRGESSVSVPVSAQLNGPGLTVSFEDIRGTLRGFTDGELWALTVDDTAARLILAARLAGADRRHADAFGRAPDRVELTLDTAALRAFVVHERPAALARPSA